MIRSFNWAFINIFRNFIPQNRIRAKYPIQVHLYMPPLSEFGIVYYYVGTRRYIHYSHMSIIIGKQLTAKCCQISIFFSLLTQFAFDASRNRISCVSETFAFVFSNSGSPCIGSIVNETNVKSENEMRLTFVHITQNTWCARAIFNMAVCLFEMWF